MPEGRQKIFAVYPGQHKIEKYKIGRSVLYQHRGFGARKRAHNVVTVLSEQFFDHISDIDVVVYDKDSFFAISASLYFTIISATRWSVNDGVTCLIVLSCMSTITFTYILLK